MSIPILVERDHVSITVGWTPVPGAVSYQLDMVEGEEADVPDEKWTSLSDKLKQTIVRKKNLNIGIAYRFRLRAKDENDTWSHFSPVSDPFFVVNADYSIMEHPTKLTSDGSSITVHWTEVPGAEGYRLRFRKDLETEWTQIPATITNTSARKKNLTAGSYYFSVMPVIGDGGGKEGPAWSYSASSEALSVAQLSPYFKNLLPSTLLVAPKQTASTVDVLAGKTVAFYFSAHWCGPCRNFTPQLLQLYQTAKAAGKPFEVVFCSADHDEAGFDGYYSSMKWAAVDFEDEKREQIMGQFSVSGIPQLTVMTPSGRVIEQNAARLQLSQALVDSWVAQK